MEVIIGAIGIASFIVTLYAIKQEKASLTEFLETNQFLYKAEKLENVRSQLCQIKQKLDKVEESHKLKVETIKTYEGLVNNLKDKILILEKENKVYVEKFIQQENRWILHKAETQAKAAIIEPEKRSLHEPVKKKKTTKNKRREYGNKSRLK